ncbi:hypothetical protein EVG20_g3049 [Dentipellis fragilis]|uniref:F-box domain-containing protein n=1 Tax=Dentipellis fragilis TaxID=205917 RepID=A0A4Y9Z772_9AGAM|nr:hypothetical protein EVG20_g3049 [Dentipellis fragilis]
MEVESLPGEPQRVCQKSETWLSLSRTRLETLSTISASSDPESIERARAFLEREIQDVYSAAAALRSRRNMIPRINRLPPEVLAQVFAWLQVDDPLQFNSSRHHQLDMRQRNIGWVRASHVCRFWRQAALEYPALWSTMPLTLSKWMKEAFVRSKEAPLVLRYVRSGAAGDESLFLALAELRRIKVLDLNGVASEESLELIHDYLVQPAPLLETAKLACLRVLRYGDAEPIPDNLFGGYTPRLLSLILSHYQISWQLPILRSRTLVHLEIRRPSGRRPTMIEILAGLQNLPQLDTLALERALPTPLQEDEVPQEFAHQLNLPNLTLLTVIDEVHSCAHFLSRIVFPRAARVNLHCKCDTVEGGADKVSAILPFITAQTYPYGVMPDDYRPIHALLISDSRPDLTLRAWDTVDIDDIQRYAFRPAKLSVVLSSTHTNPATLDGVVDLCTSMHLQDLKMLDIHVPSIRITVEEWARLFGEAKQVVRASVSGFAAGTFVQYLAAQPLSYIPFPKLQILTLKNVDFQKDNWHEECAKYLTERNAHCGQLRQLRLECCKTTKEWVDSLGREVGEIIWDEDTKGTIYQIDS